MARLFLYQRRHKHVYFLLRLDVFLVSFTWTLAMFQNTAKIFCILSTSPFQHSKLFNIRSDHGKDPGFLRERGRHLDLDVSQMRNHLDAGHFIQIYNYTYLKSTTVYVHWSELGLSHPLSRPSPRTKGWGTLTCGWGVRGFPIPTTGEKLSTLPTLYRYS
jgi:hypothetical protein